MRIQINTWFVQVNTRNIKRLHYNRYILTSEVQPKVTENADIVFAPTPSPDTAETLEEMKFEVPTVSDEDDNDKGTDLVLQQDIEQPCEYIPAVVQSFDFPCDCGWWRYKTMLQFLLHLLPCVHEVALQIRPPMLNITDQCRPCHAHLLIRIKVLFFY